MMNYFELSRGKAEELRARRTARILALETSCDETAAAVIENGRKILSNVVFSITAAGRTWKPATG